MSRNGSGTMTTPNTFIAGTRVLSADVNQNFQDIADEITNSLALDGQSQMSGQLKAADGSVNAPGMAFGADANTGFRRTASGTIKVVSDGTDVGTFGPEGLDVPALKIGGAAPVSIPSGIICMWSGTIANIPSGWFLCNGSNGTPDLRDRFVIGARQDESSIAKTNITGALTQSGGSKDAIVVSHTHTGTTSTDGTHSHTDTGVNSGGTSGGSAAPASAGNGAGGTVTITDDPAGAHSHTFTTDSAGSSGTNANLPPYFALAYIMKG